MDINLANIIYGVIYLCNLHKYLQLQCIVKCIDIIHAGIIYKLLKILKLNKCKIICLYLNEQSNLW